MTDRLLLRVQTSLTAARCYMLVTVRFSKTIMYPYVHADMYIAVVDRAQNTDTSRPIAVANCDAGASKIGKHPRNPGWHIRARKRRSKTRRRLRTGIAALWAESHGKAMAMPSIGVGRGANGHGNGTILGFPSTVNSSSIGEGDPFPEYNRSSARQQPQALLRQSYLKHATKLLANLRLEFRLVSRDPSPHA